MLQNSLSTLETVNKGTLENKLKDTKITHTNLYQQMQA